MSPTGVASDAHLRNAAAALWTVLAGGSQGSPQDCPALIGFIVDRGS
ncbi:MAG: hypothetical protein KAZ88_01000 [Acidimicrobiia bacterium]|nr:hypothetical protein [Acidimicrobiia bacterium]